MFGHYSDNTYHRHLMQLAIEQARLAYSKGEVPVGAVLARGDEIIAKAHNLTELLNDPTAHAEVLALRIAASAIENWRLTDTTLCVTLEPCLMCLGAIKLARVETLVFGANEPTLGAVGSAYNLPAETSGPLSHLRNVVRGVEAETCAELMRDFFKERREKERNGRVLEGSDFGAYAAEKN